MYEIDQEDLDKLIKGLTNILMLAFAAGIALGIIIAKVFW